MRGLLFGIGGFVVGVGTMLLLAAGELSQIPAPGGGGVQVMLDEHDMRTSYSNAYRIHTAAEEVVVDLGFNMPNPNDNPAGGAKAQLLFKVNERVIMSYGSAKRLNKSMSALIERYEKQFGEIPLEPGGKPAASH